MKILMICNNFPPLVDGVGEYTYCLSRELSRQGHEISVICRQNKDIKPEIGDIKVYPIVTKWTGPNYRLVRNKITSIQPDWIILQYVPYGFHPYGVPFLMVGFLRKLRQGGFRIFVFFHELVISETAPFSLQQHPEMHKAHLFMAWGL